MSTITIETPDDIVSHDDLQAVMQSARVVNSMARWFDVDFKAKVYVEPNPQGGKDRKIVSFNFSGDGAEQAIRNIACFLDKKSVLSGALIEPSQVDKLAGAQSIKMDVGKLETYKPEDFDKAAHDAGFDGSHVGLPFRLSRDVRVR